VPILLLALAPTPAGARAPNLARYPLHLHVLAADDTHRTPRMSPAESVVCDQIDDMLSSVSPNPGGPVTLSGISSDPCGMHPEIVAGRFLDLHNPDDDLIFSGAGRADLVSPPITTQALAFRYDNCSRIRVRPGFQSLPARWKRPGVSLEVLVPSDDVPNGSRPLPPVRCTFSVAVHDFVYLLLPDGRVIQVSQDIYRQKPALRVFLSGSATVMQPRPAQFTIPAHPTQ
jgi:hypothetical protein